MVTAPDERAAQWSTLKRNQQAAAFTRRAIYRRRHKGLPTSVLEERLDRLVQEIATLHANLGIAREHNHQPQEEGQCPISQKP